MASKCSLTGRYCPIQDRAWAHGLIRDAAGSTCPIHKYEPSDRGHILSDTCRHYGIIRSRMIKAEMNGGNTNGKEV